MNSIILVSPAALEHKLPYCFFFSIITVELSDTFCFLNTVTQWFPTFLPWSLKVLTHRQFCNAILRLDEKFDPGAKKQRAKTVAFSQICWCGSFH